jgi:hypothetical protein
MILQAFFNTGFNEIPESLSPRDDGFVYFIGGAIFISFLILALVKRSNQRAFHTLIQLFFNSANIDQRMKESLRIDSFASIMLLVNYLIIFSVCISLFTNQFNVFPFWINFWFIWTFPLVLLVLQSGVIVLVNWIAGAKLPLPSLAGNTFITFQFIGLLLSILSLVWVLNPEYANQSAIVFISLLGLAQIIRLLKNSFAVLSNGVAWYYILLYFCTLEILPLFVAYYYVQSNFMK